MDYYGINPVDNRLAYKKLFTVRNLGLINKGVHAKTISSRLGHADIKTTMNIYGHALESADKAAAETFDTLMDHQKSAVTTS